MPSVFIEAAAPSTFCMNRPGRRITQPSLLFLSDSSISVMAAADHQLNVSARPRRPARHAHQIFGAGLFGGVLHVDLLLGHAAGCGR